MITRGPCAGVSAPREETAALVLAKDMPYADVTASVKIEGGVIAKRFEFSGGTINPVRTFEGIIPWD